MTEIKCSQVCHHGIVRICQLKVIETKHSHIIVIVFFCSCIRNAGYNTHTYTEVLSQVWHCCCVSKRVTMTQNTAMNCQVVILFAVATSTLSDSQCTVVNCLLLTNNADGFYLFLTFMRSLN